MTEQPNIRLTAAELGIILAWYNTAHEDYSPSDSSLALCQKLRAECGARDAARRLHDGVVSAKKSLAELVNNLPPEHSSLKLAAADAIAGLAELEEYAADAKQREENT